jgi:DNA-binding MarR family transcriptional regulator
MRDQQGIPGVAFLLSQVGAHVAGRFAERVGELGLTPGHVGVLRFAAQDPGLSQQALARRLGVVPSRVVALVDDLEERGLLERRRHPADRRNHALYVSERAREQLAQVRSAVRSHEAQMTAGLTDRESEQLLTLLKKVAEAQGLSPGVHPGFRAGSPGDSG